MFRLPAALLVLVPAFTGAGPEAATRAYRAGLEAIEQGRAAEALAQLRAASSEAPTWVLPKLALAELSLERRERIPEARGDLAKVAPHAPANPRLFRVLGELHEAEGNPAGAAEAWAQALALAPDADLRARRAAALARLERHAEAAGEWELYLAERPDEHHLRALRADALERTGQLAEARAEYETLARRQPDEVVPARRLARFLERHGTPEEAAAAHARADERSGKTSRTRKLRPLPPSRW